MSLARRSSAITIHSVVGCERCPLMPAPWLGYEISRPIIITSPYCRPSAQSRCGQNQSQGQGRDQDQDTGEQRCFVGPALVLGIAVVALMFVATKSRQFSGRQFLMFAAILPPNLLQVPEMQ